MNKRVSSSSILKVRFFLDGFYMVKEDLSHVLECPQHVDKLKMEHFLLYITMLHS